MTVGHYTPEEYLSLEMVIKSKNNGREPPQPDSRTVFDCLKNKYMHRYIHKYLMSSNPAINPIDIECDYWLGVAKGIEKVDMDIGDPFAYLSQRGKYQVLDGIKSQLKQMVQQRCLDCGHTSTIQRNQICGQCQSDRVTTVMHEPNVDVGFVHELDDATILKERILAMFTGRKREILELITDENSPCHPENCKNYLKAVAGQLGCSAPAVGKHVRQIRKKILESGMVNLTLLLVDSSLLLAQCQ